MSLKLFAGTSNPELVKSVTKVLGVPGASSEVIRFKNSEVRVRIDEDVKNDTCVVIQSTSNPTDTNLMEMFLTCDALRREEAKKVIGILPYFGYARQDIQHRPGECVSSNVVIRFLESIGFHKIYTFDLHDEATQGVFDIPFKNLSALPLLADEVKAYLKEQGIEASPETVAVVSPDQGGIERARKFGEALFGTLQFQLSMTEKRRDLEHMHESKALDLYGNVENKIVVIVDDVATSGSTLIHAADFCMEKGATKALAAIVHRDFAPDTAQKLQDSNLEVFFTTDTIALKEEYKFAKMRTCSVAAAIAEELKPLTK
ncbi:MAG: ribose-phosphate diphosphokinase [Weeksellaceae bacterium]